MLVLKTAWERLGIGEFLSVSGFFNSQGARRQDVWCLYISLTRAEESFRSMKPELGLRPFRHRREDRCEAHAWITVLVYHIQRWIERSLELSGCHATWNSLKMLLQTHCYSTMIIPSKDGVIRKIRKAGKPDERQRTIYQKLGVQYRNLHVIKFEKLLTGKSTRVDLACIAVWSAARLALAPMDPKYSLNSSDGWLENSC